MGDLRNDIEKYLRGELTPAERHALEKRALTDPFLADALEGGESISAEDFSADIRSLQKQLGARTKSREERMIWLSWPMRIAAGLLIVAAATFVVVQISNDQADPELADAKPNARDAGPTPSLPDSVISDSTARIRDAEKPKAATSSEGETITQRQRDNDLALKQEEHLSEVSGTPAVRDLPVLEKEAVAPPAAAPEQAKAIISDDISADTIRIAAAEERVEAESFDKALEGRIPGVSTTRDARAKKKAEIADAAKPSAPLDRAMTSGFLAQTKVIRGKVTSAEDGDVLPGVNVVIKGTEVGAITDANGNFELVIDPSASGLVVSFIGMESQEITIGDATEVNIAMNPDMTQLSEVVVTGYGLEPEDDIQGRVTFASPAGGRAAFKKYIESKLEYPVQALENKIEGKVTIQFTVDTSGSIGEMRVVKGIGYGCDEEVMRLIKQGPKWNPMRKDDEPIVGRVKVRVRFKLPKKN